MLFKSSYFAVAMLMFIPVRSTGCRWESVSKGCSTSCYCNTGR